MILNPLEEFVVARQLNDQNDSGTYYVRAFIRNAKTDQLIATLNLDNKGSQRFTKTWQVPQDPTGQGLYITITSYVYTDSGYSTLSTVYGSEQTELLIQDRVNPFLLGGSGGESVDYKKIQKMIDKAIGSIDIPKPVEPEKFDYNVLADGFQAVISEVRGIDIPKTDLSPVLARFESLTESVKAIDIPKTDLQPVIDRIDTAISVIEGLVDEYKSESSQTADQVKEYLMKDTDEIKKSIKEVADSLDNTQMVILSEKPKPQEKPSVLDEYLKL